MLDLHAQLSSRSNQQLISTFKNLQSAFKANTGIIFNEAIRELSLLQSGNNENPATISTIRRYTQSLFESKGDFSHPDKRAYIIRVIELCCQKWDLDLNAKGLFVLGKQAQAVSFRFEGNYYIYCYASIENAIHRYPLHIDNRGIARMALYGSSGPKKKDIIEGLAQYDGHGE